MKIVKLRMLWAALATGGAIWLLGNLTACNTAEGVGEDIEEVGEEIEDAAD